MPPATRPPLVSSTGCLIVCPHPTIACPFPSAKSDALYTAAPDQRHALFGVWRSMTARRPALSCAACVAATALVLLSLLMAHVDRGSVTVLASAAPFTARLLHTPGTAAAFTTTLGLVPPRLQRSAAPTTAARPRHPVARALPSSLRPTRSCSPCSYLSTVAVAAAALTAGAVVMLRARALASCRVRRSPLASHALCIASGARATDAWAHARPGATALSAYRDVGPGSVPGSDNVPLLLEAKSAFGAELREALRRDSGEFWALVEGRVAHLCAEDEDLSRGLGQATGDRAVLWERMRDVMLKERRQTLEDILYYNFVCECRGRDLRLQAPGDLKLNLHHDRAEFEAMLDSIHSAEARDVIQTNLVNLVQPKDFVLPPVVRVSRLQVAQLYHAVCLV